MDKQKIISKIQQITEENGGKPPGSQFFSSETGIKKSVWYPNIWLRWSDALAEAGYQPNEFFTAYETIDLILSYIDLMRKINRFPTEGHLRLRRKEDSTFPSHGAFRQLGAKQERVRVILDYCQKKGGYDDIEKYCLEVITNKSVSATEEGNSKEKIGYVYLIRHGKRREYKIGKTYNPVRREGEIRLELPEKVTPIHTIRTDDPTGIEKYWHRRFADKRKEGEWFELTNQDVNSFKKWKQII